MTLLAPQDAARRLGLSTSRLAQLDREGVLLALRDSAGRRYFDADVVEAFAAQREGGQATEPAESEPVAV